MKRLSFALITVVAVFTGCKSYEDSFNRNLNSTGLYVANSASNTISMFAADPKSGILNDLGTVAAGTAPVHIAVNAAGSFAYVVNSGSDDVYVYSVDKETRKLTFKSSTSTGDNPRMIALHATKNFAYVVNETSNTISGYSVDATTGTLTSLGAATATGAATSRAIAVQSNVLMVADANGATNSAHVKLFNINTTTGATTAHGSPAGDLALVASSLSSITITSGAAPYVYIPRANNTIEYFPLSGWPNAAVPPVPPTLISNRATVAAGNTPVFFAVSTNQSSAFATNSADATVSAYALANGIPTAAGTISTCTTPGQMLINSSSFAYLVCNGENKVNAYSVSGSSLNLVGSYSTGTQPTSVAGY